MGEQIDQRLIAARLVFEQARRLARNDFARFVLFTKPDYILKEFHRRLCEKLEAFERGEIKKLMVFMPPQHGKSELTTRRFPAYLLGKRPSRKIAIASYSATMASMFNRDIQRIIDNENYHSLFPETRLNSINVASDSRKGVLRNSEIFEVVNHYGFVKTVGRGGPLTGTPVDIGIIDDPLKDRAEALSPTVRETLWSWFTDVFETRLHNDSQMLLIQTRWHEDDLAGRILRRDSDWEIVIYQAIKEGGPTEMDPRQEGEALFPEKHSLKRLEAIRDKNPVTFGSLYQQNPKPLEGLLYLNFKTYSSVPLVKRKVVKSYTDTADTGDNYLCSIVYEVTELGFFILDVIYTQDPMEVTEKKVAMQLTKFKVQHADIESNNGGRGFARNVERNCRILGNSLTTVNWFNQSLNKEVRIFTNSAAVQNMIYYPEGWDKLWPGYYNSMTSYLAKGKNKYDDAEDATTGIIEKNQTGQIAQDVGGFFH